MIGKASEVVKHLPTVFAFVDLVSAVSMDVSAEVVPSSIATPTNVASKWLLSGVNTRVPAQVGGTDEFTSTYITLVRAFRLCIVIPLLVVRCHDLEPCVMGTIFHHQ